MWLERDDAYLRFEDRQYVFCNGRSTPSECASASDPWPHTEDDASARIPHKSPAPCLAPLHDCNRDTMIVFAWEHPSPLGPAPNSWAADWAPKTVEAICLAARLN